MPSQVQLVNCELNVNQVSQVTPCELSSTYDRVRTVFIDIGPGGRCELEI